jgi:nitrogen fixation NifU-like protein
MDDSQENVLKAYTIKFLEAALRTDRRQPIPQADGHGIKTGDCGDTVEFFLELEGDRIRTIAYELDGCINTNACANAIIELVEGGTMEEAWGVNPEEVADYLESLPPDHFHCAELAVGALYLTLADAREKQKSPWKKLYR